MERKEKYYNPGYNNAEQVLRCFCNLKGFSPDECEAKLVIFIGRNGSEYRTSTDWMITTPLGVFVWTPAYRPQGASYITLEANMKITADNSGLWTLNRDQKTSYVVASDGKKYEFNGSSLLAVPVQEGSVIPYNDCMVELVEDAKSRYYIVKIDENTIYAEFGDAQLAMK